MGDVKPLSDHLSELSERSKHVEESLVAVRDRNLEALAARRTALQAALASGGRRLEGAGDDVADKIKAPWKHARTAVEHSFATVHEHADERRAHRTLAKAERHADHAERDAADAAALAVFVLDQTEYAVAEAVLARADADELSAGGRADAPKATAAATPA